MRKRIPVRWTILALLFLVTVINFIDRQALSVLAPVLREEFRLSNTQYGIIVSCFQLGMMLGEFPVGWMIDRKGARFGLSLAVLWWSLATGLHGFGRAMWHFCVLRFFLGTGECANFSGGMKVVSQWFPAHERAFAAGVFNAGSMVGSIIAPPLLVFLALEYGWRMAFVLPSLLGVLWALAWRRNYAPPEEHPRLSAKELEYIRQDNDSQEKPLSNRELLGYREVWGLILCRLLITPVVQFYWYWMPEYLFRERGLSLAAIGMFAWIPFLFGDIGSVGGGWVAGKLIRGGMSVAAARRATTFGGGALCLLSFLVPHAGAAYSAIALICVVLLGHLALSANFFARITDLAPANVVSRVTGLTGVAGGLGGMLFPLLTGWLVDRVSYTPVFLMAAIMPLLGAVLLERLSRKPSLKTPFLEGAARR